MNLNLKKILPITGMIAILPLISQDSSKSAENSKKARQLITDGEKLFNTKRDIEKSYQKFQEAVKLAPNDAVILSDAGWWIYNPLGKPKEALPILQASIKTNNAPPLAYASLTEVYSMLEEYEKAFETSEQSISFWKEEIKKNPDAKPEHKEYREEQLVEAIGRKANLFNKQAKFDSALELSKETFSLFPNTKSPTLIYAMTEGLHIKAGYALENDDFSESEKLIKECIELYKRNSILSGKDNSRFKDFNLALELLSKRKTMGKIKRLVTQKVLSFIVSSIDIDQEIKGKKIKVKDTMKEDMIVRLKAGQFWYRLYLEVRTNSKLSLEFKNINVNSASKLMVIPLSDTNYILEIDPGSISPSVSEILFENQNYDHYLFYWNGKSSGLNMGTGVAFVYSPLVLAGFAFGQTRGYSIMATNPEMYGVFDGLLHHEYGHLLEVLSEITFVHCADLTAKDKSKPIYSTWNKSCDSIYDWFLTTGIKDKYSEMNWQERFPASISKEEFQKMKK